MAGVGRSGAFGQDGCAEPLDAKPDVDSLWDHPSTPKRLRFKPTVEFFIKVGLPCSELYLAVGAGASWGYDSSNS